MLGIDSYSCADFAALGYDLDPKYRPFPATFHGGPPAILLVSSPEPWTDDETDGEIGSQSAEHFGPSWAIAYKTPPSSTGCGYHLSTILGDLFVYDMPSADEPKKACDDRNRERERQVLRQLDAWAAGIRGIDEADVSIPRL